MSSTYRSARRSTSARRAGRALLLGASLVLARAQGAGPAPAAPATPAAPAAQPAQAAQVPITAASTADAPQFAQAMEAVRRGDLAETARLCWAYLKSRERGQQSPEAGAGDKAESANFYLGEALERLGYVHAAIDRYTEIVTERRAPQLVPRALGALERLSRKSRAIEEGLARDGVLSVAEFEELPPRLSAFVHYRQAIDDLRQGYDSWAQRHLGRIQEDSPYLPMALYARAVWRVGRGEGDAALEDLGRVIADKQAPADVRSRALHQRARLLYDRGKWDEAYADLDKVDMRFEPGGEILMEKAWAKYRARDFRTALGLLHALGAPSYEGRFQPERYLLRSLIFSKYCHFRAAKRSIELFRQRFAKEIGALRGGAKPDDIAELREAAFERTGSTGAGAMEEVLRQLLREQRDVGAVASWGSPKGNGTLNQFLAELYGVKLRGLRFRQGQLLRGASEQVAAELLHANEQMNLLEYEVGLGIYRRIGRDARVATSEAERKVTIPKVSDKVYFHFDGEYWTDELPDMQFFIEDRCVD